ncbi:hypothetical protein BX070DRAFT_66005 [Coemansia spiralis]|nr:hypothetical protein BX070DRAFT_66005 [Coemansia spiralis]
MAICTRILCALRHIRIRPHRSLATRPQTIWPATASHIEDLKITQPEPPILARSHCHKDVADKAVYRLRRKLRRFLLRPRTPAKLDAMWELYALIKRSSDWRVGEDELALFLGAILRAGNTAVWCRRAKELSAEAASKGGGVGPSATMSLLRVCAKFGDLQGFNQVADRASSLLLLAQGDFHATKAIAYARADLPAQAEQSLPEAQLLSLQALASQAHAARSPGGKPRPVPPGVLALREILLSWTRRRGIEQAWATMDRLLKLGYGRAPREWNALLHMHSLDARYKYSLLEQVLARMADSGVRPDRSTYNIMMHACLLRGLQARWKDWLKRMELAGLKPDSHTLAALASQLAGTGQWSEALSVLAAIKRGGHTVQTVVRMTIAQRQKGAGAVMRMFRDNVVRGRPVSAHEFTLVAAAALDCPALWASEIALLLQCLETQRVEESAAVDAMAARLPGLSLCAQKAAACRPLLQALQQDGPEAAAGELLESLRSGDVSRGAAARLAAGDARRASFARMLNVVAQTLLQRGRVEQAERLICAAEEAQIDTGMPHTLLALIYHAPQPAPTELASSLEPSTLLHPTAAPTALLVACIRRREMSAAQAHFRRLEELVDSHPSLRAFNAMFMYARAMHDPRALERKWRQLEAKRIVPDMASHRTRIFCHAYSDDLLHTRRAYTDMLDFGYPPTPAVVGAVVRCCVRQSDVSLALTVMRHAEHEHGVALRTATYNYVLSRAAGIARHRHVVARVFLAMLRAPADETAGAPDDVAGRVVAERLRLADLRVVRPRGASPAADRDTRELRRALAHWLTSRAAFSAAPTLFDPAEARDQVDMVADAEDKARLAKIQRKQDSRQSSKAHAGARPPPPDATTFIIVMRAFGQRGQWARVVEAWDAMHRHNKRASKHAKVAPFSRMIGWVALALVRLGCDGDARELWESAAESGVLSPEARELGMDQMLSRLPKRSEPR